MLNMYMEKVQRIEQKLTSWVSKSIHSHTQYTPIFTIGLHFDKVIISQKVLYIDLRPGQAIKIRNAPM